MSLPATIHGLALACALLSATPALAATKRVDSRGREVRPLAALGWCAALAALAGAALAASRRVPLSAEERAERERVEKILLDLELAQRARRAERAQTGLRRRPKPGAEGVISFPPRPRPQEPPRPAPPPPLEPRPDPAITTPNTEETTRASEELALLLDAIVTAEHRLAQLRAELKHAEGPGAVASPDLMATLTLGPLDLPGEGTLDLGKLDLPEEVLERLRALADVAVSDGTVDLGPLELPGGSTLTALPRDLLTRLQAVAAASFSSTIDLGPPDLPPG